MHHLRAAGLAGVPDWYSRITLARHLGVAPDWFSDKPYIWQEWAVVHHSVTMEIERAQAERAQAG